MPAVLAAESLCLWRQMNVRVINANTGLQLEEGGGNSFVGCGFENIAYGCGKMKIGLPCFNDPPTAIFIRHNGTLEVNNTNGNTFYGTKTEANALDLRNENPSTVFFGSPLHHRSGDFPALVCPPGEDGPFSSGSACCGPS